MDLILEAKNKNHGSCYKQEWELIGSYFAVYLKHSFFMLEKKIVMVSW